MEEESIENSLQMYKSQLQQVEIAIQAAGAESNPDLVKLKYDLQELIALTEESLLSLKKSKLMSMIDGSSSSSPLPLSSVASTTVLSATASSNQNTNDLDSEFAAFQAALAEDEPGADKLEGGSVLSTITTTHSDSSSDAAVDTDDVDLNDIAGTKCRVPHSHDWGLMQYHNALVLCAEPLIENENPKVQVLFCNPTHESMKPCTYFIEGKCRFSREDCRYSHGYVVEVDQLEEYKDPDYSQVALGSTCYAQYEDGIWYKAMVVDIHDDTGQYSVTFDSYDEVHKVDRSEVLPLEDGNDSSISDSENEGRSNLISDSDSDDDMENDLPVYLWRPSANSDPMADWEHHTKGIGSKIMARMGYMLGEGLGKMSQGRTEPVPIQLLPSGKSLDEIMRLKEKAGDRDLYDVMKKHEKNKNKNKNSESRGSTSVQSDKAHVFDFINKKLGGKKGNLGELTKHDHLTKTHKVHISERDLHKKSDRSLNIQLFQTQEEIKNVEKNLNRLKTSLKRNEGKDHRMANQVKLKISQSEAYLERLKSSEKTIQNSKNDRKTTKKLTVF